MPLPANFNTVPVHGHYVGLDGTPLIGSVTFTATPPAMIDPTELLVVINVPLVIELDNNGEFTADLPATDDPDIDPTGFTYHVVEKFTNKGVGREYDITLPLSALPLGIDLSTASPAIPLEGITRPQTLDELSDVVTAGLVVAGRALVVDADGVWTPQDVLVLDASGLVPDTALPAYLTRDTELTAAVDAAVSGLLAGAPGALDTLNELAAAINDDASFAATVAASLAAKANDDLSNVLPATGRAALALGTAATRDAGVLAANVILGDDARLADQRTPMDGSVTTPKIVDSAVTQAKLADGAVTVAKLAFDPATQAELDAEAAARATAITAASTADRDRANHTGTQSADTLTDGATNKAFLATERTKLAGIADGATANSTDAQLRDRATHTGTQLAATISDLTETVQDVVASELVAGTNINLVYDDAAGTLTITATPPATSGITAEDARDIIGAALVGAGLIGVTVNDAADTITISTTATANSPDATLLARANHTGTQLASTVSDFTEAAQDAVGGALLDTATLDLVYNDAAGTMSGNVLDSPTVAGATPAQLRDRATHTGTQLSTTISDFTEATQDVVGALLVAGANVSLTYNDAANTLTIAVSGLDTEAVQDIVGALVVDSTTIDFTYDDAANTLTAAIVAGSVTTTLLADGAVTVAKLSFDPATQVELDDQAVLYWMGT